MDRHIDLSSYRMTIMDRIVAKGTMEFLKSRTEDERTARVEGALRHGFDALFSDARVWNLEILEGKDGGDCFRGFMDGEYKRIWRELEPESFSRDLIPEFYRAFEDYLRHSGNTENNRKDCKDAKEGR